MKKQAHEAAKLFFQSLSQFQCNVCWGLFSEVSQKAFIEWLLKDIYQQNPVAAKAAKLGPPEIKLMFETNNVDLTIRFWRHFVRMSRAVEFARYAYFETTNDQGRTATVEAKMIYENGQEQRVQLVMINERGGWRLGYLESKMPF